MKNHPFALAGTGWFFSFSLAEDWQIAWRFRSKGRKKDRCCIFG